MTRFLVHGPGARVDLRYPPHVWVGDERVPLERVTTVSDDATLAVVDGDTAVAVTYLERQQRLLLGPETVRDLVADHPGQLEEADDWTCWLPHGLTAEIAAARSLLADGVIGSRVSGELVTLVGVGVASGPTWESDSAVSLSRFEAVVTGLDILRCLGLEVAASCTSSPADAGDDVVNHRLADGGVLRQRIAPADLYAVPAFTVELRGSEGRLLLRQEMAPGAVTVWHREGAVWRSPALPKNKPNIQAPDTLPGGPETARQLAGVVTADPDTTVLPATALELITRAARLDPTPGGVEALDVH